MMVAWKVGFVRVHLGRAVAFTRNFASSPWTVTSYGRLGEKKRLSELLVVVCTGGSEARLRSE